jgi:gliding motility-associated protein GldE
LDWLSDYFQGIHFHPFNIEFIILFVIIFLLLTISSIVSASEVAFFSLEPHEIDEIKEKDDSTSKTIVNLRNKPEHLLAVILILNNFFNVGIIILSSYACSLFLDFSSHLLQFLFQTVFITFLLLLFGEIMPKIYATQNAKKFVLKFAVVFPFFMKLLYPFSAILVASTNIVNKRMAKHNHANISVTELSQALELTGDNIQEDKEILEGIINFGNISVVEIMTSRVDIVDISIHSNYTDLIDKIIEHGYSRMPVYAGSHDNIRGILYIKDLLPHLEKNENFRWQSLIRSAYFVPETKKIDDLLEEFQKNKIHMAIVVDEFGGTSGIISMEDILEEIVGDIRDEYDNEEKIYQKIDDHTFIFEAKILLHDFFKITEINEEDFAEISNDADSLAGMILELKGEIPHEKEEIVFKNYIFEIITADNRKIEKVKLHIKK